MEYYRGKLLANAAWGPSSRHVRWDTEVVPMARFPAGWSEQFHVWRMDWSATEIRLSVDDQLLNLVGVEHSEGESADSPFRQPHYLLLNLALGGTQGGDPAGAEFPVRYLVDYVRVYQSAGTDPDSDAPKR